MLFGLLILAALGTTVTLSNRFFSPAELQDSFEKGQKLYALGDFEKAINRYMSVLETESNATIDVEQVDVTVGEFILPVRVAATYQLANTYNKLGLEKLQRSKFLETEGKEAESRQRYGEARDDLGKSLEYFDRLLTDPDVEERTRVMAQYQILETNYELEDFDQVIIEANNLIENFPNSLYETAAYYDLGWANYEQANYREAIENFEEVLTLAPRGSRSDRALFQIAESYGNLEDHDRALIYLDRLIDRYDFDAMTEEELIEMTTLKIKGLVEETARELVAKAQLKKGDIFAGRGMVDEALAAYEVVPERYSAESVLVENSHYKVAELIHETRGLDAAISSYKSAITSVESRRFQAKTQLTVARLLFDAGRYEQAAEEYRVYLSAYPDQAARLGFQEDKVLLRLANCFQFDGQDRKAEDPAGSSSSLDQAASYYRRLLEEFPDSPLVQDAVFGLGFTHQLQGDNEGARQNFDQLAVSHPDHPAAPNALLQLARIAFEVEDLQEAQSKYLAFLERYGSSDLVNSVHMELGLTYERIGEYPAAIASFDNIEESWEQWSKVQVKAAELHMARQEYDAAEAVLAKAMARVEDPHLGSQLHYMAGRINFVQGEYVEAIEELRKTLELSASDDIIESALLARGSAHYELAKARDAAGRTLPARASYEASLEDMQALLERDPEPYIKDSAYRTLGASMISLGRVGEAAQYYDQLIAATADVQEQATFRMLLTELLFENQDFQRAKDNAQGLLDLDFQDDNEAGYYRKERAYSIIGNALLQEGRYKEAGGVFAEGLRKYPNSGESANMAFSGAFAQFSGQEYQAAAKRFKRYVDRFPNDRNAVHGRYYLAHSYQALTRFEQAAKEFSALVDKFPGSLYEEEALYLIGENYYNEQDFANAAKAYLVLLKRYFGEYSDEAQYALAWAYFEQEEMEEGVLAMEELVRRFPDSEYASKAQFTIGDFYYNVRNYDRARDAYTLLVENYSESEEAVRAERLIGELSEIQASLEYKEVMKLFEAKQYAEAVEGFRTIISKYPGTYTELAAYCNMGLSFEIMREWSKAVENYNTLLEKGGEEAQNADVVSFAKLHRDWIVENRL